MGYPEVATGATAWLIVLAQGSNLKRVVVLWILHVKVGLVGRNNSITKLWILQPLWESAAPEALFGRSEGSQVLFILVSLDSTPLCLGNHGLGIGE